MTEEESIALFASHRAEEARTATAERDVHIRALRAAGWTLRAIADLVGLSHTQVRNITEKGETQ